MKFNDSLVEAIHECQKQKPFKNFIFLKRGDEWILQASHQPPKSKSTVDLDMLKNDKLFEDIAKFSDLKKYQLLKKIDQSTFVGSVFSSYIHVSLNNSSKAFSLLKKQLNKDPYIHIYKNIGKGLNESTREIVKNNFEKMISLLAEKVDKKLIQNVSIYYSNMWESTESRKIRDNLDVDFSTQDIRKKVATPVFGVKYPGVWFPTLLNNTNFKEAIAYLKMVFEQYEFINDFWIYNFYIPAGEIRKKYKSKLIEYLNSKDKEKTLLFINAYSSQVVKNILIDNFKPSKFISKQRKFYIKLLEDNNLNEYAFFKLIQLGDYSNKYLRWL